MRETEPEDILFGQVLKELRLASGKSQEKLALEAGLERVFISMLERGQRRPTLKTLIALSRGLGMPLSSLIKNFEDRHLAEFGKDLHGQQS